jgi:hypothetical protein
MTYQRVSSKWCHKHKPRPINTHNRIRKWFGKSYSYKQGGSQCDCPSVAVTVPDGGFSL